MQYRFPQSAFLCIFIIFMLHFYHFYIIFYIFIIFIIYIFLYYKNKTRAGSHKALPTQECRDRRRHLCKRRTEEPHRSTVASLAGSCRQKSWRVAAPPRPQSTVHSSESCSKQGCRKPVPALLEQAVAIYAHVKGADRGSDFEVSNKRPGQPFTTPTGLPCPRAHKVLRN